MTPIIVDSVPDVGIVAKESGTDLRASVLMLMFWRLEFLGMTFILLYLIF